MSKSFISHLKRKKRSPFYRFALLPGISRANRKVFHFCRFSFVLPLTLFLVPSFLFDKILVILMIK